MHASTYIKSFGFGGGLLVTALSQMCQAPSPDWFAEWLGGACTLVFPGLGAIGLLVVVVSTIAFLFGAVKSGLTVAKSNGRARMGIVLAIVTGFLLAGAGVTGVLAYRQLSGTSKATCDESVEGRLVYDDLVVYHDLEPATNPLKIQKVQLGIQLHNRSDVPIEYVGEEFETAVEGKEPEKLEWENYAVLQPDEKRRFVDFPIDVGGLAPGKLKGTFTFVFAYGTVGNRGCQLRLKGTAEMAFDERTGQYISSRIMWDDKFRYGSR